MALKPKRIRTTFTFNFSDKANKFAEWLKKNTGDRDFGYPSFKDLRQVSSREWCVEYEFDRTNPCCMGVAIGINLA